jgi:hypothetical protein
VRVTCVSVADAAAPPAGVDLLVVGGPTHFLGMASPRSRRMASEHQELLKKAGRVHRTVLLQAGPGVREWLAALPHAVAATHAAAFDTRLTDLFPGSAARLIADSLRDHGYQLAARPEGFLVEAYEGPLCEGERERARMWGLALASHLRPAGQVCLHQR